ncbi:hypothetical protein F0344_14615 [Streptomyces finlayi]|uniref:Uncharacterized protein n=2 Tax=Streptomyces finlayi TaxID=67296 RepID=A0A7G7BV74_9ACTN|nr:hypothetical protein F0344_14615 [Streptomyces finlayi]
MSLASVAPDRSGDSSGRAAEGGKGGLQHSGGPWTSASGAADTLRTSTEQSRGRLGPAHEGVASGAKGLSSVTALKAVQESWEERLVAVRGECGYLKGALLKVAKEMGETEAAVKSSFNVVEKGERR